LKKPDEDITDDDIRRYITQENLLRRDLTPEQRRSCMSQLLGLNPAQSDRAIAAEAGVDHKTVAKVRAKMESTGEIPQLKKTTGKDGRVRARPVPRLKPKLVVTEAAALKALQSADPDPALKGERPVAPEWWEQDPARIAEQMAEHLSVEQINEICAMATAAREASSWTDRPATVEAAA
jgi:hypothetical protein